MVEMLTLTLYELEKELFSELVLLTNVLFV